MKKFVVLHTTPATIATIPGLIRQRVGECTVSNLLDDSILPEINAAGGITPGVRARLYALLQTAQAIRPDAVLCACSSIGGVVEEAAEFLTVPVLRIDGPMAEAAVAGNSRIAVMATLGSTLGPTTDLIRRKAQAAGKTVELSSLVVENAGALLTSGDSQGYDTLVGNAILRELETSQVVLLAQASMARALERIPAELRERVCTSPVSGVDQLKQF